MYNKRKSSILKHLDFLLLDILCLTFSYYVSYKYRNVGADFTGNDSYIRLLVVMIVFMFMISIIVEPYKNVLKKDCLKELKSTFIYDGLCMLFTIMYLFLFKLSETYSRLVVAYTYSLFFITSYFVRLIWKAVLKKKSIDLFYNNRALLLVCEEDQFKDVIDNIEIYNFQFNHIVGVCIVDKDIKGTFYKKNEVVAGIDDVLNYVSTNWVDEIFIACKYSAIPEKIMKGFMATGIPIHLKNDSLNMFGGRVQYYGKLANYNVITAVNRDYDNWQLILKKLIDIIGGIVGSLITVLLIIVIGPIIYIKSPGNIFYVSNRVGRNGRIFKFYKFRSMVLNADDLKDELRKNNRNKDQMMFKIENDPRVIPGIGNFIRKTSLDEFPQFFNVLKGDMSLVGTRPPTMDEWKKYTPYYRSRMSIKPGITGLWQVSRRSEITDFDEVVMLDNEYINNWSIGNDVRILFKTLIHLFSKDKGAM